MEKKIAYCGIDCTECEAFIATRRDDDALRAKTAQKWSEQYDANITANDIRCSGCTNADGIHFSHCNECEIRLCGQEKGIKNCAFCESYPCSNLEKFFGFVPSARENLEEYNI